MCLWQGGGGGGWWVSHDHLCQQRHSFHFSCQVKARVKVDRKHIPLVSIPCELDRRVRKITWRREWLPTAIFLPGESHEQESLDRLQSMGSQSQTRLSSSHFHFQLYREGKG